MVIVLPRMKIENASALSGVTVVGFPSITQWAGFVQQLEYSLGFKSDGLAVVSHNMHLHAYQERIWRKGGKYIDRLKPMYQKSISCQSKVQDPKVDVSVSLIIKTNDKVDIDRLFDLCMMLKVAGGDLVGMDNPIVIDVNRENDYRKIVRAVMPGWVLIERRDLIKNDLVLNEDKDALKSMIDTLAVYHTWNEALECYDHSRKQRGWILPISTGFYGLTPTSKYNGARAPKVQQRFVESTITLGEFVMPYRFTNLDQILWRRFHPKKSRYYTYTQGIKSHG